MILDCLAEICYKPQGIKGEDAYAYDCTRSDRQTIAVFDGCGGAGSWQYKEFGNRTGAFVAAQTMAEAYLQWFAGLRADTADRPQELAEQLHACALRALTERKQSCAPMGVSGSMVKSFPCTAAAAVITQKDRRSITVTALNAGDSRVYFLTPEQGLVQLTTDDARGAPDPMLSLRTSPAMTNLMNADTDFYVTPVQVTLRTPCAVLCATDGVFGFVRSPMDFEHMLLAALCSADTMGGFEATFTEEIRRITGDDSTCLIAFYGWDSLKKIQADMTPRMRELGEMVAQINTAGERGEEEAALRFYWERYKPNTVYSEMRRQL